mgnify:CR=1 FL=1
MGKVVIMVVALTTIVSSEQKESFNYIKHHSFRIVTATCYRPKRKDTIAIHGLPKGTVMELMVGKHKVKGIARDRGPWKGNKPHPTKIIDISEWLVK